MADVESSKALDASQERIAQGHPTIIDVVGQRPRVGRVEAHQRVDIAPRAFEETDVDREAVEARRELAELERRHVLRMLHQPPGQPGIRLHASKQRAIAQRGKADHERRRGRIARILDRELLRMTPSEPAVSGEEAGASAPESSTSVIHCIDQQASLLQRCLLPHLRLFRVV